MRKILFALLLFIMIFTCSCSQENSLSTTNIPSSASSTSENDTAQIELLETMDVTNIEYIEPYDENTIYIIGAKRDKSLPAREIVYAVCTLDTGTVSVLHREIIPIDWAYNMAAYCNENNQVKLFTGQQILTISDNKVISIENVVDEHYEAYVNLERNQMVFIDKVPPSLFYGLVGSDDNAIIFEAKEVEVDGKTSVLFPYCPRLNNSGDKILYGTALEDTSNYQTVNISDTNGSLIAESEQLEIYADFLDMLWYRDGFITLELTDSYENSPTGLATILTQYNEKAEKTNKTILHGIALSCQRKFYTDTSLYTFAYNTEKLNGIALWDASSNEAYYVRDVDGHVLAPTVTPHGRKLLWCNQGYLFATKINMDKYEKIPTFC